LLPVRAVIATTIVNLPLSSSNRRSPAAKFCKSGYTEKTLKRHFPPATHSSSKPTNLHTPQPKASPLPYTSAIADRAEQIATTDSDIPNAKKTEVMA
jgi:hypothetical protein